MRDRGDTVAVAGRLAQALEEIERACPAPIDEWEATAVVESLGWTDAVIAEELGFPDALSLGRHVHARLSQRDAPSLERAPPREGASLAAHAGLFARNMVYALPWIAGFVAERVAGGTVSLPADVAAPFSLAVLGSLITAGGFVQLIARRGLFYVGAGMPHLARRACGQFIRFGLAASIVVSFVAVMFGLYQRLFADERLVAAALHFLVLTLLWMKCAEIGIWGAAWPLPVTFLGGGTAFAGAILLGLGPVTAHVVAGVAALGVASLVAAWLGRARAEEVRGLEMPRPTALLHLLAPYFLQGLAYFAFLFADRLVAGSAVAPSSGLSFLVDARYARAADLGLMAFFVATAVAESLNHGFMLRWRAASDAVGLEGLDDLRAELARRQARALVVVGGVFLGTLLVAAALFGLPDGAASAAVATLAGAGYLLFALAAFDAMLLMSLGRAAEVAEILAIGFVVNVVTGYALAHAVLPGLAAVGLLAGSLVVALASQRAVSRRLARPDVALHAAW